MHMLIHLRGLLITHILLLLLLINSCVPPPPPFWLLLLHPFMTTALLLPTTGTAVLHILPLLPTSLISYKSVPYSLPPLLFLYY